jgi:hypothetical protein
LEPNSQPVNSVQPKPTHWPSIMQLGLSLLASLTLWGMSLSAALIGIMQLSSAPALGMQAAPLFVWAAGTALMGLLVLPSAYYAVRRLIGATVKPMLGPSSPRALLAVSLVMILIFPLVLWLGNHVIQDQALGWLFLPILHVLAVGIPVTWLFLLGSRGLSVGSPQRFWGIFSSSLVLGPFIILTLEIAALIGLAILGVVYVSSQPDLQEKLANLTLRLSHVPNQFVALRILAPLLQNPVVFLAILAYGAVIVPVVEELVKPAGVWLLLRRGLTPAQGFAGGLLSGAAYAIFESLALANASTDWAILALARVGTALLHIVTTGLTGWALVQIWASAPGRARHNVARLAITYLGVVCLHGLWNGLTLVTAWVNFVHQFDSNPDGVLMQAGQLAPFGLGTLVLIFFAILVVVNKRVRT